MDRLRRLKTGFSLGVKEIAIIVIALMFAVLVWVIVNQMSNRVLGGG